MKWTLFGGLFCAASMVPGLAASDRSWEIKGAYETFGTQSFPADDFMQTLSIDHSKLASRGNGTRGNLLGVSHNSNYYVQVKDHSFADLLQCVWMLDWVDRRFVPEPGLKQVAEQSGGALSGTTQFSSRNQEEGRVEGNSGFSANSRVD